MSSRVDAGAGRLGSLWSWKPNLAKVGKAAKKVGVNLLSGPLNAPPRRKKCSYQVFLAAYEHGL
jgi:hypothetical protein